MSICSSNDARGQNDTTVEILNALVDVQSRSGAKETALKMCEKVYALQYKRHTSKFEAAIRALNRIASSYQRLADEDHKNPQKFLQMAYQTRLEAVQVKVKFYRKNDESLLDLLAKLEG